MKLGKKPGILLLLLALLTPAIALGEADYPALEREGTLLRLQGNFADAEQVEQRLLSEFDTPVGHIFALNTIITHLTWDETDTSYDAALVDHANATINWCEPRLDENPKEALSNYYCGQANFALAYYHGLKGSYYKAGRAGTASIEYLEEALEADPSLVDAKMHLGVSYYVADNLPPFIKMFSRLLWFIPSGNSEKSLPYLRDVIAEGNQYKDVAKYIYATLLLEDPILRPEAQAQLQTLVSLYPENKRFQLRLISVLMMQDDYEGTLNAVSAYLDSDTPPIEPDLSLAKIWLVRAYMGLKQVDLANATFAETDKVFEVSADELPGWSVAWHKLTDGQLNDLAHNREQARAIYEEILEIAKSTYVNEVIIEAARAGLLSPYTL